jgi:hypothetical protein
MSYFIQAKEYDVVMHANIQYDNHAWMFVNIFFKFCILENLYKTIMHKQGFGQA